MQPQANPGPTDSHPWHRQGRLSTGELLTQLAPYARKALVFAYDGRDTQAGYHVTEVKAGRFASIDCGGMPETWGETAIQLWDIPAEPGRTPMSVGKFLAIMRKVAEQVRLDEEAKLTFEVSDGACAMRIFTPAEIDVEANVVRVVLGPRPASCKPRDRLWLEQRPAQATSDGCGCAPVQGATACCS